MSVHDDAPLSGDHYEFTITLKFTQFVPWNNYAEGDVVGIAEGVRAAVVAAVPTEASPRGIGVEYRPL